MSNSPEIRLRRAELKQSKRRANIELALGLFDRAAGLAQPVIASPLTMLILGFVAIDWAEKHEWSKKPPYDTILGPTAANSLRVAATSGFVANAFGGPAGITKIISGLK